MGTVIDSLYNPMVIKNAKNKNIDSRYFKDNDDGTFTPTPLLIRNIARDAEAYFKQRIFELDNSKMYHTESIREVQDSWEKKSLEAKFKLKYSKQIDEYNRRWNAYKDAHSDEFIIRKSIDVGGEDESNFFTSYSPDIKIGLADTIKAYNAAMELSAIYAPADNRKGTEAGPEYYSLPFKECRYSKDEFVEEHRKIRDKLKEEVGLPPEIKATIIKKTVCKINNRNCATVGVDDSNIEPFIKGLIKHITSSNAVEFKKNCEEMLTLIDTDFVMNFNDSAKSLKATEEINDSIVIYTKAMDSDSTKKFITIAKDEATDLNYKFNLSATADDGTTIVYSKVIATKADFRKALEISIDMLNSDKVLKKYSIDIKNVMEKL